MKQNEKIDQLLIQNQSKRKYFLIFTLFDGRSVREEPMFIPITFGFIETWIKNYFIQCNSLHINKMCLFLSNRRIKYVTLSMRKRENNYVLRIPYQGAHLRCTFHRSALHNSNYCWILLNENKRNVQVPYRFALWYKYSLVTMRSFFSVQLTWAGYSIPGIKK